MAISIVLLVLMVVACEYIRDIRGYQIEVPRGFQAVQGKCEYILAIGKSSMQQQTVKECAAKCANESTEVCASFQFRNGNVGGSGQCWFSPILCNPASNDTNSPAYIARDEQSPDVYFMKTKTAWMISAKAKRLASSQIKRVHADGSSMIVAYYAGCCRKSEGVCNSSRADEHETSVAHVNKFKDCFKLCHANHNCASYRVKLDRPSLDRGDESSQCFLSDLACSLGENGQESFHTSGVATGLTYIVVDRITATGAVQHPGLIDVMNRAEQSGATMIHLGLISILIGCAAIFIL